MRIRCLRCLKPGSTCLCSELRPFSVGFDLVLLQHPKERKKSTATARMAHLSIVGSRLIAGTGFDQNAEVRALLEDPSRHCVLLYPGENALNLSALESDRARRELLAGPKLTIFVLDATWPLAATMLKKTPRLLELPRVSFDSTRPSEYRFKRQPAPHCLSTLEAVSELVRLLEPKADADSLLGAFRKMVERQIQYSPGAKAPMPPIMPNDSCDRARAP